MIKVHALFISDLHLGSRNSQPKKILNILDYVQPEKIYLVGDIIDFWRLGSKPRWSQECNDVIQKLLWISQETKIFYIPGNHDEILRHYAGATLGKIQIHQELIHETINGLRYLVIHGDEFDIVIRSRFIRWLSYMGARTHFWNLAVPFIWFHRLTAGWSTFYDLKKIISFEQTHKKMIINYAKEKDVFGIICGHTHYPTNKRLILREDNVHYLNCGDWIDMCSCVVEHLDGRFEIVYWSKNMEGGPR